METTDKDTAMNDAVLAESDADIAARLIRRVAGPRGTDDYQSTLMGRAYDTLKKINPDKWTRRRVRSLWEGAETVKLREAREMIHAIQQQKQDQKRLEEARLEHNRFIAETARLEAIFSAQDEAFHSPEIEARRGFISGMDRAGTGDQPGRDGEG